MKISPACLALLATTSLALGQTTFTWSGGANGNWNTAGNWTPGVPVGSITTSLVFNNALPPDLNNNIPGGITVNSLTIGAASTGRTLSGNLLVFAGSAPALTWLNAAGDHTFSGSIRLDATLRLNGTSISSQALIPGSVSGSGGIIANAGVSVLSGANSYTGLTTVKDGALLGVSGSGVAASSGISVEAGGELQLLKNAFISKPLTLAGGLTGSGRLNPQVLGGFLPSMAYNGQITLAGASEIIAFAGRGSPQSESYVEFPVNGPVALAGHHLQLSTEGPGNNLSVKNTIGGLGSLGVSADGGQITIMGVAVNGVVSVTGSGGEAIMESLFGNGSLVVDMDSDTQGLDIPGLVSGNRNIEVSSGGLILGNQVNTFTGSIAISGEGELASYDEASLGSASNALTFTQGGALNFTNSGDLSRSFPVNGGTAAFTTNGNSGTISSNISGTGGFVIYNFGPNAIYDLTGNNTFQGGLGIGVGAIIRFSQENNLGAPGAPLIFSNGSLALPAGYPTLSRPIELTGGSISLPLGNTCSLTGNISGGGKFRLAGGGTFVLSGSSSFTGELAIIGENSTGATTLVVDGDARLGAPEATLQLGEQAGNFVRPAAFRATGNINVASTRITRFRSLTVDTNGFDVTFNQPASGRGLEKTGAGILTLNTVNQDSSGENTIRVEQGILRVGVNQAFGTRAGVNRMGDGAVLDLGGFDVDLRGVENVADTAEIRLGNGKLTVSIAAVIGGAITGPGSVVIGKSGVTSFSSSFGGINTFSGGLTIGHGGTLFILNSEALGAPGNPLIIDDGTLGVGSQAETPLLIDASTDLTIGEGGARFVAEGQSIVIARQLSGVNPIVFGGGSRPFESEVYDVRLANPTNTFTGPVQLGQADSRNTASVIVGIVADGSLGNPSNIVTMGAHFFDGESNRVSEGGLRAYADITLPASRSIRLQGWQDSGGGVIDSNGHVFTLLGAISELRPGMPLVKTGTGTLIMHGANSYTGETTIMQGSLGGNGSVGGLLRFDSDTILAPGAPSGIGTFTCGDFEMISGGTYVVNVASGAGGDRLVVNGNASVGDSVSIVVQPTGLVSQGESFVILQKSGTEPVSGTFQQVGNFFSGGVEWSINYNGGDGNDIAITALTGSTQVAALPVLSGVSITPAGASGPSGLSRISAVISGGVPNSSVSLQASSDLGLMDAWQTIQTITLDGSGGAAINNASDPDSSGLPMNFFRLRVP